MNSSEMNETTHVVLVGRHISDLPENIIVDRQENILWSTVLPECREQLRSLLSTLEPDQRVLFQNVPGILAVALVLEAYNRGTSPNDRLPIGVIVSVPGPREAGLTREFSVGDGFASEAVEAAVQFANGRAKTELVPGAVRVTVDPVTEWQFDHIEWL